MKTYHIRRLTPDQRREQLVRSRAYQHALIALRDRHPLEFKTLVYRELQRARRELDCETGA